MWWDQWEEEATWTYFSNSFEKKGNPGLLYVTLAKQSKLCFKFTWITWMADFVLVRCVKLIKPEQNNWGRVGVEVCMGGGVVPERRTHQQLPHNNSQTNTVSNSSAHRRLSDPKRASNTVLLHKVLQTVDMWVCGDISVHVESKGTEWGSACETKAPPPPSSQPS